MIDARVDDAVRQHLQKMDWLHREEEAQTLTPPPAGPTGSGGKMGFNLPLSEAPQAQEVCAPALELNAKQEGDSSSDTNHSTEGKGAEATPPKDGTPV